MGLNGFAVFGDWHKTKKWAVHVLNNELVSTFNDVYHVGDFGLWKPKEWNSSNYDFQYYESINEVLERNNSTLHVVLGNHEDYSMLTTERMNANENGEKYFVDFPNILFWPRVHTHTNPATGLTFVGVGGAGSVDMHRRKPGVSWWAEEEITASDVEKLKGMLPKGGEGSRVADVLITHEAPAGSPTVRLRDGLRSVSPEVLEYCNRQRVLLRDAIDWVKPTYAFHGHWHIHRIATLEGVDFAGNDYSTTITALDKEHSEGNVAVFTANEAGKFSITIPNLTKADFFPKGMYY